LAAVNSTVLGFFDSFQSIMDNKLSAARWCCNADDTGYN